MGALAEFVNSWVALYSFVKGIGRAEMFVRGDIMAQEVQEYLAQFHIEAECIDFTDGVSVIVDKKDKRRTKAVLRAWGQQQG